MSFPIPSAAAVCAALRHVRDRLVREGVEETDVRLQVTKAGWAVLSGSADYDQNHYGHWGAANVGHEDSDFVLSGIAFGLVSQVVDSVEQSDV